MSFSLRYLIPVPLKKAIKYVIYSAQDSLDFLRGRRKGLPPRRLNFVGSHDFERVGQEFFQRFTEQGGLTANDKVLDIGCGIGRMALPLTKFLYKGTYSGFDIDRRGVEWCQKKISSKYPNFQFEYVDLYNRYYNPQGEILASEFCFPYEDQSFDFIFATSVFTHMLTEDSFHYLEEIARVLKPGGTFFATFFLLDEESRALMEAGKAHCHFNYAYDSVLSYSHKTIKEAELAYSKDWLLKNLAHFQLDEELKIYPGKWSGRADGLSYQDLVITHRV